MLFMAVLFLKKWPRKTKWIFKHNLIQHLNCSASLHCASEYSQYNNPGSLDCREVLRDKELYRMLFSSCLTFFSLITLWNTFNIPWHRYIIIHVKYMFSSYYLIDDKILKGSNVGLCVQYQYVTVKKQTQAMVFKCINWIWICIASFLLV